MMAENTKIEWATHTFNPWRGCTKVSAGCANCYAETLSGRNPGTLGVWGPNGTRVVASESMWKEPLKWDKAAAKAGERHRVFCASLADVFEDWGNWVSDSSGNHLYCYHSVPYPPGVSDSVAGIVYRSDGWTRHSTHGGRPNDSLTLDDVRRRLFDLIDRTPNLDWLLLTKRPENIARMLAQFWLDAEPPRNVWLGTSVENQATADERIPRLLKVPAKVRFLSMEPLLGPVDLSRFHIGWFRCPACGGGRDPNTEQPLGSEVYCGDCEHGAPLPVAGHHLHWVIVGGESGNDARPMHWRWAHSLRDQCQEAGIAFHFKQWGEWVSGVKSPSDIEEGASQYRKGAYHDFDQHSMALRVGKKAAGRMLDGRTWDELPTD